MATYIAVLTYDDFDGGIFSEVVNVQAKDEQEAKVAAREYAEKKTESHAGSGIEYEVALVWSLKGLKKVRGVSNGHAHDSSS